MRSYLRHRAGLPPLVVGAGALNQGHQVRFERELLVLHDVLPKDSDIHDGLQLVDGGNPNRYLIPTVRPTVPVPAPAQVVAPVVAASPVAPVVVGALPAGVVLPPPPHPMRLQPLPPHLARPGAAVASHRTALVTGQQQHDVDDEEEDDDEIRPVNDERADQWRAYRDAGF